MRTVAFVPARGGSKGLPGKNLAEVGGVSLVGRAVLAGRHAAGVDEVVVSSDDDAILEEARRHGATPDRRPAVLADDEVPTIDVVVEYLARTPQVGTLVLLQPTSPLREPADVEACLAALATATSATTVSPAEHPPAWLVEIADDGAIRPLLGWEALVGRRQDAAPVHRLNGAVYAASASVLREQRRFVGPGTVAVVMPAARSVDVDTAADLALARALWHQMPAPEEAG